MSNECIELRSNIKELLTMADPTALEKNPGELTPQFSGEPDWQYEERCWYHNESVELYYMFTVPEAEKRVFGHRSSTGWKKLHDLMIEGGCTPKYNKTLNRVMWYHQRSNTWAFGGPDLDRYN